MNTVMNDIEELYIKIANKYGKFFYDSYLQDEKNLINASALNNFEIESKRKDLISKQEIVYKTMYDELKLFDSINVPIIGLKGLFLKNLYYDSLPRKFGDIDILVSSDNAKPLYNGLRKLGYHIEYKTLYDNPIINMNIIPKFYMDNTQTLMLINPKKKISIDIHSNLNITNAHFVKSETKFNTDELFSNSIPFDDFTNIYALEPHDNLCFLFRHLLKHHVFYGKTQSGLETPLQLVIDLALIINSDDFNEDTLLKKTQKYNIIPEAIFCLNLYNKIFINSKQIDILPYLSILDNIKYKIKWKPILLASLNMKVEDVMVGNYKDYFPKLQRAVEFSKIFNNKVLEWVIQGFIVSFSIEKLL